MGNQISFGQTYGPYISYGNNIQQSKKAGLPSGSYITCGATITQSKRKLPSGLYAITETKTIHPSKGKDFVRLKVVNLSTGKKSTTIQSKNKFPLI